MNSSLQQKHSWSTIIFCTSRLFERAAYYGIRAILVLYLLEKLGGESQVEVLEIYARFTGAIVFLAVLGGLLGTFVLKNKTAVIIGGFLQVLGILLMWAVSETSIYLPLSIIVVGCSLFEPNFMSLFGKSYLEKPRIIESGFTFLYLSVNLGALIGVFFVGIVAEKLTYELGFTLAALFMLIAIVIAFFFKEKESVKRRFETEAEVLDSTILDDQMVIPKSKNNRSIGVRILILAVCIILVTMFWHCYEYFYTLKFNYKNLLGVLGEIDDRLFAQNLESIVLIVIGLGAGAVWTFVSYNKFIKLGLGILMLSVMFVLLNFIPIEGSLTSWTIMFAIVIAIAEIHVAPVLDAAITENISRKFLPLAFSISKMNFRFLVIAWGYLSIPFESIIYFEPLLISNLFMGILLVIGVGVLIFGLVRAKKRLIS
ncbi:MAG: POT family proton-dependent oligopeptide transporter [Parvicellaceae bacterium]